MPDSAYAFCKGKEQNLTGSTTRDAAISGVFSRKALSVSPAQDYTHTCPHNREASTWN